MKPTIVAFLACLLPLAGCGATPSSDISMTLVVRDVYPLDLYGGDCKLKAPDIHELVIEAERPDRSKSYAQGQSLPPRARKFEGGCEAPGVRVRVPAADEYVVSVATEDEGSDPREPLIPDRLLGRDGATVVIYY